jgi:hypothetical protein
LVKVEPPPWEPLSAVVEGLRHPSASFAAESSYASRSPRTESSESGTRCPYVLSIIASDVPITRER